MLLRFQCSKSTDNPKIYVSSAARQGPICEILRGHLQRRSSNHALNAKIGSLSLERNRDLVGTAKPTAKALSEAREFARRMSSNEVSNDEFWRHCIAQGFYIPFDQVPQDIDDDLYLIEDDVTPERYAELESGAPASAEELRKWTDAWIHRRLENPIDHNTENIDILQFRASDGWTGVLVLGCHSSLLETPDFGIAGLYNSVEAAVEDLRRNGHLKI